MLKPIIAGVDPVCLTAAYALLLACADYLVLEPHPSVTIHAGASLALWPRILRALAQLGLRA